MTFSFGTLAPGPRALLPIFVTVSQSASVIFIVDVNTRGEAEVVGRWNLTKGGARVRRIY